MQNEERINVLETQVRTLKRIVYGFGCLLVAGLVVGATSLQTVPDVIQAKKFEVVNGKGNVVAKLSAGEYGGVLRIRNKEEKLVAGLYADEDGGAMVICNKDGEPVATIWDEHSDKLRGLNIYNKDSKVVVRIGVDKDADGFIQTQNGKDEITSPPAPWVDGLLPPREPQTAEQINMMSLGEAKIALKDVSLCLSRVGSDSYAKKRLRNEMRMLLDRMKEINKR